MIVNAAVFLGQLHIQIATQDNQALAFITNDFTLPKNQWFRLTIQCNIQQVPLARTIRLSAPSVPPLSIALSVEMCCSLCSSYVKLRDIHAYYVGTC